MTTGKDGAVVDEYAQGRPAPALRSYVAQYTGYRQAGVAPAVHRGLPSPYLTLIVTLDDPLLMLSHPDPAQPGGSYDALIGGLHTSPAMIANPGRQSGVQISLHPAGALHLFGVLAGELAGLDVAADAIWGPLGAGLRGRLLEAPGWPERFAVLDRELLAQLARQTTARPRSGLPPEVTHAWRRLQASRGRTTVAELAADTGWSSRHLGTRFRSAVGLSPKSAARVVRFDRARRLLAARAGSSGDTGAVGRADLGLAGLAADCGYFDQAHLARDFRDLAGCAPSVWLAEEFRNVQAGVWLDEQSEGHD